MSEENTKQAEAHAPSTVSHLEHTVVKTDRGRDITFKSTNNNSRRVLIHTLNLYFAARAPEDAGQNPAVGDQEFVYALASIKHTVHNNARDGSRQDEWSYHWRAKRPDVIAVNARGHVNGPNGDRQSVHDVEDRGVPLSAPFDPRAVNVALATIDNPAVVLKFLAHYLPDELEMRKNF